MIVVSRNGRRTVISGWRGWLIGLPVLLVAALVVVAVGTLVVGVALSIATLLLFGLPLAVVFLVVMLAVRARA